MAQAKQDVHQKMYKKGFSQRSNHVCKSSWMHYVKYFTLGPSVSHSGLLTTLSYEDIDAKPSENGLVCHQTLHKILSYVTGGQNERSYQG